jgi:protein HIRA/HIR1
MAIDVHPQGGRLVSCGAGITVWNLRPILDPAAAAAAGAQQAPRQLAHLGDHQQAVNVVRFSHDGAYFASGSDDSCIFVYELRPGKGASSFGSGSSKPNLENWRIKCMLRSHSSNVADLDWAPGDQYLASASFDNKVLVWDLSLKHPHPVVTLEHNGMAKGVAWDPLGKYLASMGDDGLRLWDARTWRQVLHLEEPFRDSNKQNYHLRCAQDKPGGPKHLACCQMLPPTTADIDVQ